MFKKIKNNKGFTMIELIIVIVIFTIIFSSTSIILGNIISEHTLNSEAYKIVQAMREVRINAVSQKGDSKWGIKLLDSTYPDRYVLFRGLNYGARNSALDVAFVLPKNILITNINLGGGDEIIFDKRSGYTSNQGDFSFINDNDQINFTVNDLGLVDYY